MKEQLRKLRDLQAIDLAQEDLRKSVEKKRADVDEQGDSLRELEAVLQEENERFSEKKKCLENKKNEKEEVHKGYIHAEEKLNAVTNSREYANAEREIENHKKMEGQLDTEIEALQKDVDKDRETIEKHTAQYAELEAAYQEGLREVENEEASIKDRVNALKAQSEELAKGIKPQIFARYRFIRSKRPGEAVVSASNGTCMGCHMKLQPQAYIVLQRQNSLECCQNCQRIIYFDAEEAQKFKDAKEKEAHPHKEK